MSYILKIIIMLFVCLVIGFITPYKVTVEPVSILYTLTGIIFSIGIGFTSTFNLSNIKNIWYLKEIRKTIRGVRNFFIIYFAIATLGYVFLQIYYDETKTLFYSDFNVGAFVAVLIIYVIFSMVLNFTALEKLRDDIADRILEEQD